MEQGYSWNADSRAPTKDIPVVYTETVFTRVCHWPLSCTLTKTFV